MRKGRPGHWSTIIKLTPVKKSTFQIADMDCTAEEQLVRMALEPLAPVRGLDFDLPQRRLTVYHDGEASTIAAAVGALGMRERLVSTEEGATHEPGEENARQRMTLWWVLGINAAFFVLEMTFGLISSSMGLVADSLDMLADASVYALSLLVVGAAVARKKRIARISGYVQMGLAVLGFVEVGRRFLGYGEVPDFRTMIIVATLALLANLVCLWLIQRVKSGEAHMQASAIFTSNDIIVNGGVILSGVLVYLTASRWPDLIVGALVFAVVLRGATQILRISR